MKKILIIIFLCITLFTNDYFSAYSVLEYEEVEEELTIENVYKELIKQDVLFVEIVLAQVILETGHLKHVPKNNLFGFYNGHRYLEFDSWKEAVAFKKKWQEKKYKGGDYYVFLETLPYAEDKNYISKLKQINKNVRNY